MPCFDKKLEGARNDFFDEDSKSRDVDCVLATMELLSIIEERGCDFRKLEGAALDPLFRVSEDGAALVGATDSGASGGYLDDIFRHAAAKLFGRVIEGPLPFKVNPRIPDLREVVLEVDGKPVLHFVIAYGFRNVQNLVRKIKKGGCGYHYVEVMACPSGCLNGGGQIKPASRDPKAQKALLAELDRVYHSRRVQAPESSPIVQRLYRECFGGAPGAPSARKLLHTQFHAVDKAEINPLAIKW
jgi:iron only hydrogenase large subunit-like protein